MHPGSLSHGLLTRLLELSCITQNSHAPIFSTKIFKILCVAQWAMSAFFIFGCLSYILIMPNDHEHMYGKLKSTGIVLAGFQFQLAQFILWTKRTVIGKLVDSSRALLDSLQIDTENDKFFKDADFNSRTFVRSYGTLIVVNLPSSMLQAAIVTYITGQTTYPFEIYTYGLPVPVGWILMLLIVFNTVVLLISLYSILRILVYQTEAYSKILARMLRDRLVSGDSENDKKIQKLFCDIGRLKILMSEIFGPILSLEVFVSGLRNCVGAYAVIKSASTKDYMFLCIGLLVVLASTFISYVATASGAQLIDQTEIIDRGIMDSKWYECSPANRKAIIGLLSLNQHPIGLHYRRFMYFNMETFANVINSTYTLTTALANFI